jgi:hypothetical protein
MRTFSTVLLVVCCAACDRGEVRELEARQRHLDKELVKLRDVAETLSVRRAELDRSLERLATFGTAGKVELTRLLQLLAAVAPRQVVPSSNGQTLRVEGGGGARGAAAAWHALGPAAAGVWLRRAEVSGGNWLLELDLVGPELPPVAAPPSAPLLPPDPPEGRFCGQRCQRLRAQNADTERRIAELTRVALEVKMISQRQAELTERFGQLDGTLAAWLGVLDAWFGAERPLLDEGKLSVNGREGRLTGFALGRASQAAEAVKALADANTESSAEVRVKLR